MGRVTAVAGAGSWRSFRKKRVSGGRGGAPGAARRPAGPGAGVVWLGRCARGWGRGGGAVGFEGEGVLLVGGEVILVGEGDGGGGGLVDALAEHGDGGAGRGDGDGQGEGAAVFQGNLGGEVFAGVEVGAGGVVGQG